MIKDKIKLGIVVAEFNYDITRIMLEKAISHAKFLGAEVTVIFKVPGTYDLPYGAAILAEKEFVDGIVALGAVIEGETEHDEVVAHQAARKLLDIGDRSRKPVALGVIGPGASRMQALERAEEYARRAVEAAIKLVKRAKELQESRYVGDTLVIE